MPYPGQQGDGPRLAVNILDVQRVSPEVRAGLLGGKLDLAPLRTDAQDMRETAWQFSCDLLTAATCLDVIRSQDRTAGDAPTRCYLRTAVAWNKIPAAAMLTVTDGQGQVALNPRWFPWALEAKPLEPQRAF